MQHDRATGDRAITQPAGPHRRIDRSVRRIRTDGGDSPGVPTQIGRQVDKLVDALEFADDAVLLLDMHETIEYANDAAGQMLHAQQSDLNGMPYADIDAMGTSTDAPSRRTWLNTRGQLLDVDCRLTAIGIGAESKTMVIARLRSPAAEPQVQEDRLQRVFEDSGIGMLLIDSAAEIQQFNLAFANLLGGDLEGMECRNLSELMHPEDHYLLDSTLENWRPGERFVSQFEVRFIDNQERPVWTLVTLSAITTSPLETPLAVIQVQDITDQQLTVQALRLSQERFQDFASAASDWMWEMGPELRFSYFSRRLTELTGASSLKLLGRTIEETEIGSSAEPEAFQDVLNRIRSHKPFRNFVYRRERKGGGETWLSVSGKPIFDEAGVFQGYRGTGTDISERVKVEEELRLSEERMRVLSRATDQSKSAIAITNPRGIIQYVNRQYTEMTGFAPTESIGRDITGVIAGGDASLAREIRGSLETHGNWEDNTGGTRHSGEQYWQSISIFSIRDEAENVTHFAAIIDDITAIKRTELELHAAIERTEIANRAKSDFLANMSHELRTPMNAIIGFSEAMTTEMFGPLGSDRYREYINDIKASAHHLLGIINDILDISKIEAGEMRLDVTTIHVPTIIRESIELMRPRIDASGLVLKTDVPPSMPDLLGDERALKQIMLNLLSNSAKFTPPNGEIEVTSRIMESHELEITVRDTGIGIEEHEIESILLPFKQSNTAYDKPPEGTGLGLTITKSLVELHDGTLFIESRKKTGTKVTMRFPEHRLTR